MPGRRKSITHLLYPKANEQKSINSKRGRESKSSAFTVAKREKNKKNTILKEKMQLERGWLTSAFDEGHKQK